MSQPDPTLFLLHFLGGSARTWEEVCARLAPRRCVAVDLPGFGDAAGLGGRGVAEMAEHVAQAVRAEAPGRWALVGHSMGGKVAAVLARRAEDGEAGLEGLVGVVLLAASPAGPEPIEAGKRAQMLGWFRGDEARSLAEAAGYVAQNVGAGLPEAVEARTVADVLRADPAAWRAWLEHGSREDWVARVGVLGTPALVVAGAEDDALGADAQRVLVTHAFARWRAVTLEGAGHLLPVERPDEVAGLVAAFVDAPGETGADGPGVDPAGAGAAGAGETHRGAVAGLAVAAGGDGAAWRALLGSDRVSARTRAALLERARPDEPEAAPRALSGPQVATLRLVLDRVVPQPGGARIDLAARVDAVLAAGVGDGWRLAGMPPDAEACRAGLDTLEAAARQDGDAGFAGLADAAQDALLGRAAAGTLDAGAGGLLDAARMQLWFEELRSMAVRAYVAHPATLARMGYSGIGYGGDGPRLEGFVRLGIGAREDWEPVAEGQPGGPAAAQEGRS